MPGAQGAALFSAGQKKATVLKHLIRAIHDIQLLYSYICITILMCYVIICYYMFKRSMETRVDWSTEASDTQQPGTEVEREHFR